MAGILGIVGHGRGDGPGHDGRRAHGGDIVQALAVLGASLFITAAVIFAWLRHLPNSGRFGGLFLRGGMDRGGGLHLRAAA